jgi:hypothetical protein
MGQIAEAAHVVTAADCLHIVKAYVTVTPAEIVKGMYPLCDFNVVNGVKHSAIQFTGVDRSFGYCTKCLITICSNCDMNTKASILFITSFNIFSILLSNIKKLISVFIKYRSVTPYIFIGLCSLFIVFFSFDFSVISIFIGLCSLFIVFFSFSFYFSVISCDAPIA